MRSTTIRGMRQSPHHQVHLRLDEALYDGLEAQAQRERITVNALITRALKATQVPCPVCKGTGLLSPAQTRARPRVKSTTTNEAPAPVQEAEGVTTPSQGPMSPPQPSYIGARDEATAWLARYLFNALHREPGSPPYPVLGTRVQADAKRTGITVRTLRRAADDLHIEKSGRGGHNVTWSLPDALVNRLNGLRPDQLLVFLANPQALLGRTRGKGSHNSAGRTKAKAIREAILELVNDDDYERMTVRQVYYALVSAAVVTKDEKAGYNPVQSQLTEMRLNGTVPWEFIADGTRIVRMLDQWDSVDAFIEDVRHAYRRNLWRGQGCRVEVWLEKDALAEIVYEVTSDRRVRLMVSRGISSLTFVHTAALEARRAWEEDGDETFIYALYDYDAGGERGSQQIERLLPRVRGR